MKLNTLVMQALDWPVTMAVRLRDLLEAGGKHVDQVELDPLDKRCYTISESHLSGYRLILGFETLDDVQDAHEFLVRRKPQHGVNRG